MSARPKHSVNRQDYRQLADVKLPIVRKGRGRVEESSSTSDTLYRLQILEEDQENGRVKVGYVGYGDEFDEWRRVEEVVSIDDDEEVDSSARPMAVTTTTKPVERRFCLFEELSCKIKTQLLTSRKANPVCSIVVSFDFVHFDSLAIRGFKRDTKGTREIYSVTSLTKLDDLLGERWYIRGINMAGDFCYVEPDTVRFYLKKLKRRRDFQMQDDGTLVECGFGGMSQLVFQFVRSEGTFREWSAVLRSCV